MTTTVVSPDRQEARRRRALRRRVGQAGRKTLAMFVVIVASMLFIGPYIWSLSISFQPPGDVFSWPIQLLPDPATLENYRRLWTEIPFSRWLLNSTIIVLCVTISNVLLASLAGYAFARIEFPGRQFLFYCFLATLMVPGHVTLVPKFMLLNHFGMINTYQGLIIPGIVQVFGVFLMKQFFETLPKELEEAARIDGCSRLQTFWKIILPVSKPALVALAIYTFQGAWNDFLWPVIVTTTPDMYTLPLGMAMFRFEFKVEWTMLMAGSVLLSLPMLIIFISFQRLFVQNAATSGTKG